MPDDGAAFDPSVHPAVAGLAWLVGTWWGFGVGGYPGVEAFRFEEELSVINDGRPLLTHRSRTWLLDDDGHRVRPSHAEDGWWRPGAEAGAVELLLAHATGLVEISLGRVTGHRVEVGTDLLARTATATPVGALTRLYGLISADPTGAERPDLDRREPAAELGYAIDLAAGGHPLQAHVSARLTRLPGPTRG